MTVQDSEQGIYYNNRNEQDMSQQEGSIEMGWCLSRRTTFDFLFISIVALRLKILHNSNLSLDFGS
jgi:hypothetical protein